jgi:hypothetical protein
VWDFKKSLTECLGFTEDHITVMIDTDSSYEQPTVSCVFGLSWIGPFKALFARFLLLFTTTVAFRHLPTKQDPNIRNQNRLKITARSLQLLQATT